eukprot:841260-Pleurochrysis_carterae.AAC.1
MTNPTANHNLKNKSGKPAAHLWQINKDDIAQLTLCMICDTDRRNIAVHLHPLMLLQVAQPKPINSKRRGAAGNSNVTVLPNTSLPAGRPLKPAALSLHRMLPLTRESNRSMCAPCYTSGRVRAAARRSRRRGGERGPGGFCGRGCAAWRRRATNLGEGKPWRGEATGESAHPPAPWFVKRIWPRYKLGR